MSAPVSEEGFHEIQLSGKQLVFLFMATTVVSVVIFLLGVVVGRRVPAETIVADATGTTLETIAPDQAPPAADAGQPAAEPPTPVQEEPDQFSYHQRLQQAAPPVEDVQPPPSAPPAQERPAAAPPPSAAPTGGAWFAQIGAYRTREAADGIVARLTRSNFPALVLPPTPGSPSATFRVRVGPYRERREAEAIAGRLERELQFTAFVTR